MLPKIKIPIAMNILPWYLGFPEESVSDVGLELKTVSSTAENTVIICNKYKVSVLELQHFTFVILNNYENRQMVGICYQIWLFILGTFSVMLCKPCTYLLVQPAIIAMTDFMTAAGFSSCSICKILFRLWSCICFNLIFW